jgi:septal ring factor EnvC (AmiA/AmiB activator)
MSRAHESQKRSGEGTGEVRRIGVIAIALLAGLSLAALAQTPPTPPSDRQRIDAASKRTADRLRALQKEADALVAQERTLLVELRKLEVERQIAVEQSAQIERDHAETQAKLAEAESRAAELGRRAASQLPDVEARLVQLYKLGRAGYWRLLLNAEDLHALGRAYRTASMLNTLDRARITEHYATLDALANERKTLQARAGELEKLKADGTRTRDRLAKAVAGRSALVKSIDARRDLNAQLMGELQAAQQRLQGSLAQLDTGRGATPVLPLRPFQGDLPWPAAGSVSRRFGRQPDNQFGTAVVRNGMDVAAAEGQPVRAIHEGTVAYADQFAGYGNLVIVDHGGRSYSLYGYLASLDVTRGERVQTQAVIGTSGRNPSGNPALYFELRVDGVAVDPLQWLRKRP